MIHQRADTVGEEDLQDQLDNQGCHTLKGNGEHPTVQGHSTGDPRAWIERASRGEVPLTAASMLLGLRLAAIEDGAAFLEWPLDNRFLNGVGVVQGGLLASFADSCMAFAVLTLLQPNDSVAGTDLRINFLRAVRSGTLRGEGRVLRRGRRVIYVEATISDEDNKLVARAGSTFQVL
ncbi:MAG: PaaI family thioesterase [Actinobacteria bacterium]|nr:PaaI family thioesterase [Actinomycetota bacterium]